MMQLFNDSLKDGIKLREFSDALVTFEELHKKELSKLKNLDKGISKQNFTIVSRRDNL